MKQGILDGCLQGIDDALQVCDVATALMLTIELNNQLRKENNNEY